MKKAIVLLVILTISNLYSQNYTYEDKTMTGIFDVKDKSQSELFSLINKWISINYNSSKDVIQLNDKESGTIIIKGVNETKYKNATKELYPNNKYVIDYFSIKLNHLLEINIKEEKYRVIYSITDIVSESSFADAYNYLALPIITFKEIKQPDIDYYNLAINDMWKSALIGKKKRASITSSTRPNFEELNSSLKSNVKNIMVSIQNSVIESKKDNW